MKELIGAVIIVATVLSGPIALRNFQSMLKKAALEKAAQGLPPLSKAHSYRQYKKVDQ